MHVVNAPLTTLLTSALNKPLKTQHKKPTPSSTAMNESTSQNTLTNMGLLSSFSVITQSDTTKTNTLLHKLSSMDHPPTPSSSSTSLKRSSVNASSTKRKPSELKFKMESIGTQPEEDDDLDMCPARTREVWPRQRKLIPWWQPTQPKDKPPYSYATLIAYSILISQDGRLLLSDIYRWISETYPYYILENRGWQNSIRHNLSLNKKWFLKVDRRPTQANPGKGCYWTLVPGTEQMFMENITEAGGGHNRKHHDIGLTNELSMGHRNNLMVKHHYHSSSHSGGGPRQPGSGATFSNANMKITRPEDYQQPRQKSSSSIANDNKKVSAKSSTPAKAATPKSCKPVTAAPSLGPMYTTFHMTSTTMKSVSQESQDASQQKKMKRQSTDDLDMTMTKRPKLNPASTDDDDDDMMEDYLQMDGDHFDNQSDCDSGVDISNELLDGKKNTTTTTTTTVFDHGLALTNEELGLYNVLDHFLDQLPLPGGAGGGSNEDPLFNNTNNNNLYTTLPMTGFPMNPSDIDPVLGYPSYDYYSTNGFFYDTNNNNNNDDDAAQVPMNGMYPTVLTSRYDPPLSSNDNDTSNRIVAAHDFRSNNNNNDTSQFGMMGNALPQQQATTKGPLVIRLSGAPGFSLGGGGGGDVATGPYGMVEEEMTDAYLKFEDDEVVLDTTKDMMMGLDYSDMTATTTGAADGGAFRQDFLNYNFTTMCDLLES